MMTIDGFIRMNNRTGRYMGREEKREYLPPAAWTPRAIPQRDIISHDPVPRSTTAQDSEKDI